MRTRHTTAQVVRVLHPHALIDNLQTICWASLPESLWEEGHDRPSYRQRGAYHHLDDQSS